MIFLGGFMNTHSHPSITSMSIKLSLLLSALISGNAIAEECTSLKLISARNAGVTMTDNACKEQSKIAVGTNLQVSAGSRLWIKSAPEQNGVTSQVICQNRSSDTINVTINSDALPWIKPQGLNNCGEWVANKLSCDSNDGQKNGFFCALASSKPLMVASAPKPTTSFKMRSTFSLLKGRNVEEIIKDIKPEVELCKNLYGITSSIKVSWDVSKLGTVEKLSVDNDNTELAACIGSVLKPERHEQSSKETSYKQDF